MGLSVHKVNKEKFMSLTENDIDTIIPQNVACKQTFKDFFAFHKSYGDVTLVCHGRPMQNSVQNDALPASESLAEIVYIEVPNESNDSTFEKCSNAESEITLIKLNSAALDLSDKETALLEETLIDTENVDPNIKCAGTHNLNEMHTNRVNKVQDNNSFESIKDAYTASM